MSCDSVWIFLVDANVFGSGAFGIGVVNHKRDTLIGLKPMPAIVDGGTMEKIFGTLIISDEPETFVCNDLDDFACDAFT